MWMYVIHREHQKNNYKDGEGKTLEKLKQDAQRTKEGKIRERKTD